MAVGPKRSLVPQPATQALRQGFEMQSLRARRSQLLASLTQVDRRRQGILAKLQELDDRLAVLVAVRRQREH